MAHQSYAEEQTKIAKESAFVSLGRAIADGARNKGNIDKLLREAAIRRAHEQTYRNNNSAKFAALVRQVGDAINVGESIDALIAQLVDLRSAELR